MEMSNYQLSINNYQLPKGYKQTEVGVIPEDWELKRLIEVVDYVDYRGKTPPKQESGIILVTARNIRDGFIDYESSQEYVSEAEYDKIMRRGKPEIGDVLITTEAPLGNVAAVDNRNIALAQRVIKYRAKNKKLNQEYLKYYLLSKKFQRILQDNSSGSTAQGIKGSLLHTLPIIIATEKEQRAIATTLSDVDALIAALDKLIAKQRHLKTATMQQLLTGKKRLPRRMDNGELIIDNDGNPVMFGPSMDNCQLSIDNYQLPKGYKQTEVGVIPEDWEVKKLGQVLQIRHGRTQHEVVDSNGIYPILATGGEIGRTNTPLYSEPSVLIGRKGTIDIPYYMDTPFWTVDTLFYSEISKDADPKFIFYKFNLIDWYSYNEASGVPSLNAATIESIDQAFPPSIEEQCAIATVLSDMDAAIAALENRRAKTQAIKQGMMQELLTGKTRLINNE